MAVSARLLRALVYMLCKTFMGMGMGMERGTRVGAPRAYKWQHGLEWPSLWC